MACSTEFIDFVYEVLAPLGDIRARKMMGDYILYLNEKCVATLCDNNVYLKIHPSINEGRRNWKTVRRSQRPLCS